MYPAAAACSRRSQGPLILGFPLAKSSIIHCEADGGFQIERLPDQAAVDGQRFPRNRDSLACLGRAGAGELAAKAVEQRPAPSVQEWGRVHGNDRLVTDVRHARQREET